MDPLDRVLRASPRPIPIGIRLQIRFKDRFDYQLGGGLHHPVPNCRNPERTLAASGLRDHHPPHRLWLIRLAAKVIPEAVQPLLQTLRLDHLDALPIHSRRALVGLHPLVGMGKNVLPIDLVVEQVEAISRLFLRLQIQLLL